MKSHKDTSKLFLNKAHQDLAAAQCLSSDHLISDEVIGFHLQQAIEKALKAFLTFNDIEFRKTHDIRELFDIAISKGLLIPTEFSELDEWTPFGVELRYDDIPVGIPVINRETASRNISMFVEWVERVTR